MKLHVDSDTAAGLARACNEDALLVAPALGLFVVCDGVGGGSLGDRASATCVAVVGESIARARPGLQEGPADARDERHLAALVAAFEAANAAVHALGDDVPPERRPSTTASALLVDDRRAYVAHVGDSRIYRIRGAEVLRLTVDHTMAEWARRGGLPPASADRFVGLTAAIGRRPTVTIDTACVDLEIGDRLLLCTDGLHAHLDGDAAIVDLVGGAVEGAAQRALALARARGGDDVTAVVLACVRS